MKSGVPNHDRLFDHKGRVSRSHDIHLQDGVCLFIDIQDSQSDVCSLTSVKQAAERAPWGGIGGGCAHLRSQLCPPGLKQTGP